MYWNKAPYVCHQEAMCNEDMPAVFQYFTKVLSFPVPPSPPFYFLFFFFVVVVNDTPLSLCRLVGGSV